MSRPDTRHVTIADVSEDILHGPYEQALRDELRRQFDALGVELRLGTAITEPPRAAPATLPQSPSRPRTAASSSPTSGFAPSACGRTASTSRAERCRTAATSAAASASNEHLRVVGETQTFALGDLADADRDIAGLATAQAGVVAADVRALITGTGELTSWKGFPPLIAIPLGPEGGAGFVGDGVADAATIADLKGRHMGTDRYAALFDTAPPLAA
jgi:apoptosis-inducing factor 2